MRTEYGAVDPAAGKTWKSMVLVLALVLPMAIHLAPRGAAGPRSYSEAGAEVALQPAGSEKEDGRAGGPGEAVQGLRWVLPAGWSEEPGADLRLATLRPPHSEGVSCAVTALPGTAGSLRENVARWADQIGLVLDEASAARVAALQQVILSRDGSRVRLLDFTPVAGGEGPSLLVGMVFDGRTTYFLKLTGARQSLEDVRGQFLDLCRSITVSGTGA